MKATKYLIVGLIPLTIFVSSCSENTKSEKAETESTIETESLQLNKDSVKVEWTAFKTTDKTPVKGVFRGLNIETLLDKGNSPEEILNDSKFTIDVRNLSTGNPDRDVKIRDLFFGLMAEKGTINGKLNYANKNWNVEVQMNGATINIPAKVEFEDKIFKLKTTIMLGDFNALSMLKNLNTACFELHKGADGISKTWEEVEVEAIIDFN